MPISRLSARRLVSVVLALAIPALTNAQSTPRITPQGATRDTMASPAFDSTRYGAIRWRSIGPFRGGRVTAVAGVASQPLVYYMGATGGGVWKTDDAGNTWRNVSDGQFRVGSIGAIAVAPDDPNVVYVGTGEAP